MSCSGGLIRTFFISEGSSEWNSNGREYPNGDKYIGPIVSNRRNGKGTYICENGDQYVCEWVNDRKEGFGVATFANGCIFRGLYKNNEKYFGEYIYKDGERFKGFWKANMKHGRGIYYYPNKSEFHGCFEENRQHSHGYLIEAKGEVFEQEWAHGVLLSSRKVERAEGRAKFILKSIEAIDLQVGDSPSLQMMMQVESKPTGNGSFAEQLPESSLGSIDRTLSRRKSKACGSTPNIDTLSYIEFKEELGSVFQVLEEKQIGDWDTEEVLGFLRHVGFEEFAPVFQANQITGASLVKMTRQDLQGMGIVAKGDVIRLTDHIEKLIKFNDHEIRIKFLKKRNLIASNQIGSIDNKLAHILERQFNKMIEEEDSKASASEGRESEKPRPAPKETLSEESGQSAHNSSESTQSWKPISTFLNNPKASEPSNKKTRPSSLPHSNTSRRHRRKAVLHADDTIINSSSSSSEHPLSPKPKRRKILPQSELSNFIIKPEAIRLKNLLQEGAFGKVFLGSFYGLPVAVKVFKRQGKSKFHVHSFLKEVSVISDLRHPNILLYMGICIYRDNCLMISEFLENGSLYDHFHRKHTHFEFSTIRYIIIDIMKAMAYVHSKGFLHCDIKSSNILIDKNWNIKLADFGLSKKMRGTPDSKKSRVGTPNWMAPEVCRGEKYCQKSDVYSFGVVLWEIASKQIPHEGETPEKIYSKVGYNSKMALPIPEGTNPSLSNLIKMCLRFDKESRPTFSDMLQMFSTPESTD